MASDHPTHVPSAGTLRECQDCGLLQHVAPLPPRSTARCPRCGHLLRHTTTDPFGRPLALAVTGLALMLLGADLPFMHLSLLGVANATTLLSGPVALQDNGMGELALVILGTTLLAPTARLLAIGYVLAGLRLRHPPAHLARVFRWAAWLRPWSMVEVFLLGVFVAYTKLVDLAQVQVGGACYAMGALMLVMSALDALLDPQAVWEALPAPAAQPVATPGVWVGCHVCGLVNPAPARRCARCGSTLHRRKPDSMARTAALLVTAICFYVPANILPVLTLTEFGRGAPSTIIGGAIELLQAGMWPLALLVFFASITVPVLKILGLGMMLLATRAGSAWRLRERTVLFRVVRFIGRWSMIDVFMISILTALVHLGFFAQVYPGSGVLAFCAVVIVTMLAAETFDPRLMWDAAAARQRLAAGAALLSQGQPA